MAQSKTSNVGGSSDAPARTAPSKPITLNRPGAPANPPQHLVSEEPEVLEEDHLESVPPDIVRQTGVGTAPPDRDVSDPHPPDEEHYGRIPHPGGANPPPPNLDIGADPERHDGSAPPPPANAERDKY